MTTNQGLFDRARQVIPGGVNSPVRAFSSVDATQVEASARRSDNKLGVPVAGDDDAARDLATRLVRDAGCEPVIVGGLAAATSFQAGVPGFRHHVNAAELRRVLGLPDQED